DRVPLRGPDPLVCGAFKAILQGDHSGVEIATAAHEGLLEDFGLLAEDRRLVAGRPPPLSACAEALVIDDFFAVSPLDASSLRGLEGESLARALRSSAASESIARAKEAYDQAQLAGSDHKDNLGSLTYTVAGAEVCSELELVENGAVFVGAPLQRRLALAYVTLKAAALPATSEELVSSMLGSWVSYVQFRRPFACFLDSAFKLGVKQPQPVGSPARPLPRKAACELSLLAACAPLLASNIAVPYDDFVYCADASLSKGAFCRAKVGEDISEALWHSGTKGGHTRVSMDYDFVEVLSATSEVSQEFDLLQPRVFDWLVYLVSRGRLRSMYIRMPSGTFSRAFRPPSRSARQPLGRKPVSKKVVLENRLASRAFALLRLCRCWGVPCVLSCSSGSFFFELPASKALATSGHFRFVASARLLCGLGPPCHLSFWTVGVPPFCSGPAAPAALPFGDCLARLLFLARAAKQHINVFESGAALSCYKKAALGGGRSSARLLRASLKKVSTTQIAGGIYASLVFGPTRWNPADDPTRDVQLRVPAGTSVSLGLSRQELRELSSLRGLSRPRANWVRLALVTFQVPDLRRFLRVSPTSRFATRLSTRLLVFLVKAPSHAWPWFFSFCGFAPGRFFPGTAMTSTALTVAYALFLLAVRC
ncbi:unnamed protein product, partial [Symbiodinium sp. KB8]